MFPLGRKDPAMLEIHSNGLFNIHYLVFREQALLARFQPVNGPLSGAFEWQGRSYTIRSPASEGMLRGVQRALTKRAVHELHEGAGRILATAHQRGWSDQGHAIEAADGPCSLDWDPAGGHFRLRRQGAELGTVRRSRKARCSVDAQLPEAMPLPLQVFIGLLALARWETVSNSG
jgi:hypothetical protein